MSQGARRDRRPPIAAGLLLGVGLGGFVDGIVFHQILQWHHMLTSHGDYPVTTVAGLEVNTLWDGLFHAGTWLITALGLALLWRAARRADVLWSTKAFVGLLLAGWGGFNLVEGVINHLLLRIHHVRTGANELAWDLALLVVSAVILLAGWLLVRAGAREAADSTAGGERMPA